MGSQRKRLAFIPSAEIDRFVGSIPRNSYLFPEHPDRRVRKIALRDVYRSVLRGLRFIVDLLNDHDIEDLRNLFAIFVNLQTSLNPFLSKNPYFRTITATLAQQIAGEVEDEISDDYEDVMLLCDLHHAVPALPARQRRSLKGLLRRAEECLHKDDPYRYVLKDNPVTEAFRAGDNIALTEKDLDGGDPEETIWALWMYQVLEVGCCAFLGFDVDVERFYERTVLEIVEIPFREGYEIDLVNVMTHASYGMTLFNRRPMFGNAAATRLAAHGVKLFEWLERNSLSNDDAELLAEFLDGFLKGPSLGYNSDPCFGTITERVLDSQEAEGNWAPVELDDDDYDNATDYLYDLYHPTWACIDGLRPMKNDLLNPENGRLGLI